MKPLRLGVGQGKEVVLVHPDLPYHFLFSGRTRSGKSSMGYVMLVQLVRCPWVVIAGVDQTGIVFSALRDVPGSHLRVSTGRDPEAVKRVMQDLVELMDGRIDNLLSSRLDKLADFTPEEPLVVVVLEEYAALMQSLAAADRASGVKVADRAATAVELAVLRLAAEGAKVGIRLIISTQHPSSEVLTTAVRSQLVNRISFAQGSIGLSMVHEDLPDDLKAAAPHFKPGEGIAELEGGRPIPFKADYTSYSGFCDLIDEALVRREATLANLDGGWAQARQRRRTGP